MMVAATFWGCLLFGIVLVAIGVDKLAGMGGLLILAGLAVLAIPLFLIALNR